MISENILLTGLPRSGTTMVCRLLNKLPNTIALVEPMPVGEFPRLPSRSAIVDEIEHFAETQRASLCSKGVAITRHVGGTIGDNLFSPMKSSDGLRPFHAKHGSIRFEKPLSPDLKLILKHPAAFTALLPELNDRFRCYAIIRNPLSALASWNSTRMPVNEGRAPAAEQLDVHLNQSLQAISNRFERQLFLLNWYFEQYWRYLPPDRIVKYEDIVESGGTTLATIVQSAETLNESLESQNRSDAYDWNNIHQLAERLLATDGTFWEFYSRGDIELLLK